MVVTAKVFGLLFTALWNKEIDYDTDTINVMLLLSGYTPDQDTHDYVDDVRANEHGATGNYSTDGATLGSKTVTYTAGTNTHVLDAADTTWSASTITARYAVVCDFTPGTDATRPLICYQDFGADQSSSGGDFTIEWNASGIIEITVD